MFTKFAAPKLLWQLTMACWSPCALRMRGMLTPIFADRKEVWPTFSTTKLHLDTLHQTASTFFFRKCNNSTSKRGESVLLSVLLVLRTDFLSSHKWRTVPLTEGAAQLELQPFTGWTSAHSFINKTSCGKEALIFASDFSFSGPDARGEQEPDMFTSVGDCEPGARLREQEWLPMADPPADGFDFMCEPSRGSLIQLGAFIQPRECSFPRRVWSFLRASA